MRQRARTFPAALGLAMTGLVALVPVHAGATPSRPSPTATPAGAASGTGRFDVRQSQSRQAQAALANRAAQKSASSAVQGLRSSLGPQAVIDIDPTTLTPRSVARLDGFLTGASSAAPARIAVDYVTAHRDVFGLSAADLAGLKLSRDYVDIAGVSHLSWVQVAGGVPVFDNGLKANVAKDGRLINVQGSPVSGLRAPTVGAKLSTSQAISAAKASLGSKSVAPQQGDVAKRVLFVTAGGTRPAYQVVTMTVADPALLVLDAVTGRVLYRAPLSVDAAAPDKTAAVFANYPGAPAGGTQQTVDLTTKGWLPAGKTVLSGNNAHTYTDVNDDNQANPSEEVHPNAKGTYVFPQVRIMNVAGQPCSVVVCTWRPNVPYSWQTNRSQTSTQNFYFINKYHDHLAAAPIGFTEAAGNFQKVNYSGKGQGGDAVQDQPLDGADTASGLPDPNHIDNANFATPPDGQAPVMQMYLFHQPGARYPGQDPFIASSGSDSADIVYHEYTHGLSHRLVVDANNVPALDSQQGGSMGEAWSDWYAFDYLVDEGLVTDTLAPGQIKVGDYVLAGGTIRSEATDCPVGASAKVCPGTPGAGPGGYTYGDFGKIYRGGPEVHADGEIWAQTLWDLRTAVGSKMAESLVTRGMELSATYPSFLDMRNAIIQADVTDYAGKHVMTLWKVFAKRGMGFFAGTLGGNDVSPVQDFSLPPTASTPKGTVTGTVRDSVTGAGVKGAVVAFGGHETGFPGSYAAVTNAAGKYSIRNVVYGRYPDVYAVGAGYNGAVLTVNVHAPTTRHTFTLVRDWAASSGGASVAATNGDDGAIYGCGAAALINQAFGPSGWSTANTGPKYVTVKLPAAVDISSLQIDPSGTCGDDAVAAAGKYTVETSGNGTTFALAASGSFLPADTGRLTTVPLKSGTGTAVRYIRYTILTNQAEALGVSCPSSGDEGCPWLDSVELEVFGGAS